MPPRVAYNAMKGRIYLILALALLLAVCGCTVPKDELPEGEGFAIYLLAEDIPASGMPPLSNVELADEPFISLKDIISYKQTTHEIELAETASQRVAELEVPLSGKVFVVCVNRQPVYWGAFWTPISSMSFDGITIWILTPLFPSENVIHITLGYPSEGYYSGEDPRSDTRIMQSLEQTGKLR